MRNFNLIMVLQVKDSRAEFTSANITNWCKEKEINIRYIQPGKPVQNGFIERFNGSYRRKILDAYLFLNWQKSDS